MKQLDKIIGCFPVNVIKQIEQINALNPNGLEEIRVYKGSRVELVTNKNNITIPGIIDGNIINSILNNLMKNSYYSYEEDIAKGFITVDGGHRVGICGKVVLDKGKVRLIRDVSSLNIRCSREIIGCGEYIYSNIKSPNGLIKSTLIVSPPGCGKTTLLRDLARLFSMENYKISICDERSEIAGMVNGRPSYTFGKMVDVLDGCPKEIGMPMLIRSMSPQVIITDEIGKKEDVEIITNCINCGVRIITSIHGESMDDLAKSQIYSLIEEKVFNMVVFLSNNPKVGTIKEVIHV